jgi:hypothetical protein
MAAALRLADLFKRALIIARFLDTPNEPFDLLPFADFLSPLPILCATYKAIIAVFGLDNKTRYEFLLGSQGQSIEDAIFWLIVLVDESHPNRQPGLFNETGFQQHPA